MLHAEPPNFFPRVEAWDHGTAAAARCEKFSRRFRVADGCGQADPPRPALRQSAEPLDQAEGLHATVSAQQRMNLIDDDEAQISEQ